MKSSILKAVVMSVSLMVLLSGAQAQNKKKGETITTKAKLVVTKLKVGEGEAIDVRGKATYTLTAANSDGSLAGTITYALPDEARQKISEVTGKPLASIPASITQADVVAEFQKLTECPVVHLDFKPMDVMVAGAKLHFNKYVLDISDEGKEINNMVCIIARQINAARPYRGPVRRINEIINGLEPAN